MSVKEALAARHRSTTGTRPARRLRREGAVPGVVYGKGAEAMPVTIDRRELLKLLHARSGEHALVTLRVQGMDRLWEQPVLVKTVQYDPVDGRALHVDFHAIVLTERLRVKVPVVLKGESVGVKQDGGILEHFLREVEVECLPTEIPAGIDIDVSALKIGETVHVRDLAPPRGAKITSEPEGVIASVQKPREERPAEEAAVTEPEVIREKKEAGEEVEAEADKDKGEKPEAKKDAKA